MIVSWLCRTVMICPYAVRMNQDCVIGLKRFRKKVKTMRLIDGDALLYHLSDYQLQESPGWGANGYGNADAYEAITNCIKAIENAPTIEPDLDTWKEVYAESDGNNSWIEFQCPHCGETFGIESGQYGWHYTDPIPWKACPMCGGPADMRGDK